MNYVTITEFIERVGSDNMDDLMKGYSSDPNAVIARQEQILNEAEGVIDGYASVKWATPMYTSPDVAAFLIKYWVLNIAQYELYIQMEGNDIPDRIKRLYEDTINELIKLSEGKIFPPPGQDGTTPSVRSDGTSIDIESDDPVFNANNIDEYY